MNKISLLILLLLVLILCGCVSPRDGSAQVKVVATIIPLGEFVRALGGDRVAVSVLVPPGADPHTFEPSPSQMREVANANAYMENGVGLESWMANILKVNSQMLVVDTSRGISLIGGEAASAGSTGTMAAHIWLSPRNAVIQVQNICDGLISVDPAGKDYYINNRDNYVTKLMELDAYLNRTFAGTKKKKFVVLHPAWIYFARDFGLEQISAVFLKVYKVGIVIGLAMILSRWKKSIQKLKEASKSPYSNPTTTHVPGPRRAKNSTIFAKLARSLRWSSAGYL